MESMDHSLTIWPIQEVSAGTALELMNISSVLYLELMKANQLSRDFSLPSLVVPPKQRIPSIYSFPSFVLQLHIDSLSIPFLTFSIPSLVA